MSDSEVSVSQREPGPRKDGLKAVEKISRERPVLGDGVNEAEQGKFSRLREAPGEFRREQNWIGGRLNSPIDARYVPPPEDEIEGLIHVLLSRIALPALPDSQGYEGLRLGCGLDVARRKEPCDGFRCRGEVGFFEL